MALDGIVISALTKETASKLIGGRIDRIHQPEKDELIKILTESYKKFSIK